MSVLAFHSRCTLYLFSAAKSPDLTSMPVFTTSADPHYVSGVIKRVRYVWGDQVGRQPYLVIGASLGWPNSLWKEIKRFL